MDKTTAWLILNMVRGIGPASIRKLMEIYNDPREILESSDKIPQGILQPDSLRQLREWRNLPWEKEIERTKSYGIKIICLDDSEYPDSLRQIPDPPQILYIKGNIPDIPVFIGVVGTRNPSSYGILMAEKFTGALATWGICVVSGMARGIDTIAHKTALKMKTPTIAVLGCGLANIYPPENKKIAELISETGALISEFPLDTTPEKFNFPRRNRIISGISRAVLVVEAGLKSGAIITAHLAIDQNKDVFVLPSDANRLTGRGNNLLIREGACLVETPEEIIEHLNLTLERIHIEEKPEKNQENISLTDSERLIYNLIKENELSFEEIQIKTGKKLTEIASILTNLEIKGLISSSSGQIYTRKNK